MNNIIEFKKDCIMKTMVSEITDISLSHDYKILDDVIEGYFDVTGEYKITAASVSKEEFMYTIPFSIAISSLIDKSSINITIDDFNYSVEKDILHLNMKLNMEYTEIEEEYTKEAEEPKEEENLMDNVDEMLESLNTLETPEEELVYHNELMNEEKIDVEDKKEAEESMNKIMETLEKSESYYKYKVYIMRSEDTIESIAIKYNISLEALKEYNNLENINIGDKIVIPFIENEEN